MIRSSTLTAVLLAVSTTGCHFTPQPLPTTARVTGVIGVPSGNLSFADLDAITVGGSPLGRALPLDNTVHTRQPVKIHISNPMGGQYDAVFGPHPDSPNTEVSGKVVNPLFIYGGYAFAWGRWPMVRTQWIQAGAEGTTLAVEILQSLQRVYFLRENITTERVKVTCGSTTEYLTDRCTYVEVDANCNISPPAAINSSAETRMFISAVRPAALGAGWNEAGVMDCTQ